MPGINLAIKFGLYLDLKNSLELCFFEARALDLSWPFLF